MLDPDALHFLPMYCRDNRHYHDVRHITNLLEASRNPVFGSYLTDYYSRSALYHTILAHDCVYDAARDTNEVESASRWESYARGEYPEQYVTRVARMIVATTHRRNSDGLPLGCEPWDVDGALKLMLDLDLHELGSPWTQFSENTRLIRQEFAHVPWDSWHRGRIAFFQGMLDRDYIYWLPESQELWEVPARENMRRGIEHHLSHLS